MLSGRLWVGTVVGGVGPGKGGGDSLKRERPTAGAAGRLFSKRRSLQSFEPQAVVSPSSLPVASPKLVTGTPIKSSTDAWRFAIGVSSAYLM